MVCRARTFAVWVENLTSPKWVWWSFVEAWGVASLFRDVSTLYSMYSHSVDGSWTLHYSLLLYSRHFSTQSEKAPAVLHNHNADSVVVRCFVPGSVPNWVHVFRQWKVREKLIAWNTECRKPLETTVNLTKNGYTCATIGCLYDHWVLARYAYWLLLKFLLRIPSSIT